MKAGETKFQDLLSGTIQYRVPLFQRTYSWTEDNWQRLWDDILEIYAMDKPRSHFLGAVVTLPIPDAPENAKKYVLIDGQQRLITLLVLLACIRDEALGDPDTSGLAEQIVDECLINKYARIPEEREKMKPTQQDLAPFRAVMQGEACDGDNLVAEAKRFFAGLIGKGDLQGDPINLTRLKNCVTAYLDVVSVTLDQGDSPHRIFESLNNTGMVLSASDLVRNYVFMSIPTEAEQNDAYERHWLPMQRRTEVDGGKSVMSDFFWRYLMTDGDLPRYDEVYEAMRDHIDKETSPGTGPCKTVVDVLRELDRNSCHYMLLWDPEENEADAAVSKEMQRLNEWEVDVAYPFLLSALDKRKAGVISDGEYFQVLQAIESYVVRRIVCGIPTNRLRRVFARMSGQVEDKTYVQSCREYLRKNDWPSDTRFKKDFQAATIYIRSRLARTRLILTSLEESYDHHEQIDMTGTITIEHLMPQTLNDWWRDHLGASYSSVHEEYLDTIGNLTYSGYNTEMGNKPFPEKKKILAQSHFEMNRGIIKSDQWALEEIKARAAKMAERALTIWER